MFPAKSPDLGQRLGVGDILRPSGLSLEGDEVVDRCHTYGDSSEAHRHRAAPELGERHRRLEEQVHHRDASGRPEREHQHPLVAGPGRSLRGIGEVARRHRNVGLKARRLERAQGPRDLLGLEIHHQVDVARRAKMTVEDDREPTDHDVAAAPFVQVAKQGFQGKHRREYTCRLPLAPDSLRSPAITVSSSERDHRRMLEQGQAEKELLLKHGLGATPLDELSAAIDQFDASVAETSSGTLDHVVARAELEELSDEVMRLVGMLDGINRYRFERDPQLLVAWKTAKHVVSGPQVEPTPVPPAAGEEKPAA